MTNRSAAEKIMSIEGVEELVNALTETRHVLLVLLEDSRAFHDTEGDERAHKDCGWCMAEELLRIKK